jgi:SAM-dependent methyltransferase
VPSSAEYDRIGTSYVSRRRPDPRIAAQISAAIGSGSVLNVGAGAGSYEPSDGRRVVALEPSATMRAQRPPGAATCVAGVAEALPFPAAAFDVAMVVLSVHHWSDRNLGLAELRRVAARQVVLTYDPSAHLRFWMVDEYLPEVADLPGSQPPAPEEIAEQLGGGSIEVVPMPADCADGVFWAYWRRPEAYLDPLVQASISAIAQLPAPLVAERMARLADDLASGAWAHRHADLLDLDEIDGGYRLVITDAR